MMKTMKNLAQKNKQNQEKDKERLKNQEDVKYVAELLREELLALTSHGGTNASRPIVRTLIVTWTLTIIVKSRGLMVSHPSSNHLGTVLSLWCNMSIRSHITCA